MEFGDPRLPDRFWDKVEPQRNGCWLWVGAIKAQRGGRKYASYTHEGKQKQVTTVVGLVTHDDFVPGTHRFINTCDNKYVCANPAHVEMILKDMCKNGHERPKRDSHNNCIECKREKDRNRTNRPSTWSSNRPKRKKQKPIEGFTVFGDRETNEVWRPAGWPKEVLGGRLSA